jgi:hypothetical protein
MVQNMDDFIAVGDELVLDLDPPIIIDNTPEFAYTGNNFTFNVTIIDDSEISEATLIYRYNENPGKNGELVNTHGDYWEYTIEVEHTLGSIFFMYCIWDCFGNNNHTEMRGITIIDDDFPEIFNISIDPLVQMVGEKVDISVDVTDNINVSDVGIYMVYPDSTIENYSIKDTQIENTYYSSKTYDQGGVHELNIWAIDAGGNYNESEELSFEIVLGDRPSNPHISGETEGKIGESYTYEFSSSDPDGDDIYYYIEWGDGNFEDWIGPYDSGEVITMDHTWDEINTYTIKAKAKDTKGLESDWGSLTVTMPKTFNLIYKLVNWLVDSFPNLFPLFRILIMGMN